MEQSPPFAGESDFILFPVPDGAEYGDCSITKIQYNKVHQQLSVYYEGRGILHDREQLVFVNCEYDDETVYVKPENRPASVLPPHEAKEKTHRGAIQDEKLYDALEEAGLHVDFTPP